MKKFIRTEQLIGKEALKRLAGARIAVFGLGAVGSYAVEALARSGVGYLRLVDFDVIKPSNFNRQLYALDSNLGLSKTEVAERRVRDINSGCVVDARNLFFNRQTKDELLDGPLDVVVDAIDSLNPKVELLAAAVEKNIKVVSSMGAASRFDPLKVRVGDISQTHACPLARFVRKRLKRKGVERGIRCVFSVEETREAFSLPTDEEEESLRIGRSRRAIGSFSYMTGIFGLTVAREALATLIDI